MDAVIALVGGVNDTPRKAGEKWALNHFNPGRKIDKVVIKPEPLTIEFTLVGGYNWYCAKWDDMYEQFSISKAGTL